MSTQINNPILPGFHPDPSILRVGDDYYIATSTFEWYPGVRIYHSKDLLNWNFAGSPLDHYELLDLRGVDFSDGIWAPDLSYSNGYFYLIYTVVHTSHHCPIKDTPNYLTRAKDITGPWSMPVYLNSSGFDPSLFHDDDGRKWIVNMRMDYRNLINGRQFTGVMLQEYDEMQECLIGEPVNIFDGTALRYTEGPHLYKKDGYYYLMCAEGGTGWTHAVTLARSKSLNGPYEVHPYNPVLTSWEGRFDSDFFEQDREELGIGASYLKKAGHASICNDTEGNWYLVHLCGRPLTGTDRCILGRETSIQQIVWKQDGWPYLKNGGRQPCDSIVLEKDIKVNEKDKIAGRDITYTFENDDYKKDFQTLRIPYDEKYISTCARKGCLRLTGRETIFSRYYQTILARRQTDFSFIASTVFEFDPTTFQHSAGLIYRYNENNQYYLYVSYDEELESTVIIAASIYDAKFKIMDTVKVSGNEFELYLEVAETEGQFSYMDHRVKKKVGPQFDVSNLSDDFAHGFTGAFVGICVQDIRDQKKYADFKSFRYTAK